MTDMKVWFYGYHDIVLDKRTRRKACLAVKDELAEYCEMPLMSD